MNVDKRIVDGLYRKNVGMVVVNPQKKIFIGKRIKNHNMQEFWQMPQGGIDDGENESVAMKRELLEETGIKSINIIKESKKYYYYNFPHEIRKSLWNGRYIGQKQKWFLIDFKGKESEINLDNGNAEFSHWKWERAENIIKEIIEFKKDVYEEVLSEFGLYKKC
jgi:putative (di)nucleoside polyphosphate hydrolase